jgi:parallel beta-helix repeat protein
MGDVSSIFLGRHVMKSALRKCAVFVFALFIAVGVLVLWFAVWPEAAHGATYTVTLTTDTGPMVVGELRWAINSANATPGVPDTINFNIPGPGPHTISPTSALTQVTDQLTIDGYTQPGSAPANGGPAAIMIELDGSAAGVGTDGLYFRVGSSYSRVRGLAINGFNGDGIHIDNATNIQVDGNYIGTDVTGSAALPNNLCGVYLTNNANNITIGGTTAGERNVISGNNSDGILITTTGNAVEGNYIGTDAAGTASLPNASTGVYLINTSGNTIGGTTAGERNVISGNQQYGVRIEGSTGSDVQGNYIGTDVNGTAALPNSNYGIHIRANSSNNTIGGATTGHRNVISGNASTGITIEDSTSNIVEGNLIGTEVTGTASLPNTANGISIINSSNNAIGGATAGERNVISGNASQGIQLNNSTGNTIEGNYIGTDINGTAALANGGNGVDIGTSSNTNTVGGTTAGESNLISGNSGDGVRITGSTGNTISANHVGTNPAGTAALANGVHGIRLINGADDNTVGGSTSGERNLISGNSDCGVVINDSSGNDIQGNYIGTDINGTAAMSNIDGVVIRGTGATGNTVGGRYPPASETYRNLISGNSDDGIELSNGASDNEILGNFIGTDISGTTAIANGEFGVEVNSSDNNAIGRGGYSSPSIISGNGDDGVFIGGTSTANRVGGNLIGTDLNGTGSVPNSDDGLEINGCSGNTISGNTISGNGDDGIELDAGATGNYFHYNDIGTDIDGTNAIANGEDGIKIKPGCDNNEIGGDSSGGNRISGNTRYGIFIENASGTQMYLNRIGIGVTASGYSSVVLPNGDSGVYLCNGADNNIIGSTIDEDGDLETGNVISGNTRYGIFIENSSGNMIRGNYIGMDYVEMEGDRAYPNGDSGVYLCNGADGNTIGGESHHYKYRNIISGNEDAGITIESSTANIISCNYIGTDSSGRDAIPNDFDGIDLLSNADNNTVQENEIKNNGGTGVMVDDSVSNKIYRNSIYENGGLGILLSNGGNNDYAAPVISSAYYDISDWTLEVEGTAPAYSDVEIFYVGPDPDPSGSGEGLTYLTTVPSDGTGYFWTSTYVSRRTGLYKGGYISATATSQATGDTSQFGTNAQIITSSVTWYLAEGSTGSDANGSFETWILVQNPGDKAANVDVTYMTQSGEVAGPSIQLGPGVRWSVNVAETVPDEWHVSTMVEANQPVVAERSMYWDANGTRQAAHSSIGTMTPSSDWYFAEGSTGSDGNGGFETWVLVQNPGDEVANIDITYMTQSGEVAGPSFQLPPRVRWSTNTADTVPGQWHVAAQVSSDQPVVAERSMYWNSTTTYRQSAHSSIGSIQSSDTWYLAEGSTGSDASGAFETYVLVQNPSNNVANVDITYMTPQGAVAGPSIALAPKARWTANAGDTVPGEWGVAARVSSDQPVIATRSMYWTTPFTYRQAASSSIGAPFASNTWNMAEGSTSGGMETYILVQNPGQTDVVMDMKFLTDSGEVQGPKDTILPAASRYICRVNDYVDSYNASTVVNAGGGVVVVRSMYGDSRAWSHSSIGFAAPPN